MEDHDQPVSAAYLRQYNNGYLLSKHEPELADKLGKAFGNAEMFAGFQKGREQYALEQQREKRLSWLYRERSQPDKDRQPEKDGPDKG